MLAERFWARVTRGDGCWGWNGAHLPKGYGSVHTSPTRTTTAHRVAYELAVGPIPDGYEIDHLCRNPGCVRPSHLEAVTPRENWLRSDSPTRLYASATHCVAGHPFSGANLWVDRHGHRHCRACRRSRQSARRQAIRLAAITDALAGGEDQ